jgi:hypothetical protein
MSSILLLSHTYTQIFTKPTHITSNLDEVTLGEMSLDEMSNCRFLKPFQSFLIDFEKFEKA